MKGEAFLLAALIISVSLVALYQPMRSEYLIKQKQLLESEFFLNIFENILNEIKNSIYFSYDNFDSMILNSYNFLNLSQKIVNQKTMNFESLILILNADGNGMINLTAINFLSSDIQLNLNFNDTQNSYLFIPIYSINSTTFTYVPGNSHTLLIQYENIERKLDIETKPNKKFYLAYIDVSLAWLEESRRNIEYFLIS